MIECLFPPFRKWTEKGSIYITGGLKYVSNFEEAMTGIINTVTKDDTLIVLGDYPDTSKGRKMMRQVKGYKVLVRGPHDGNYNVYLKGGEVNYTDLFDEIYKDYFMISNKLFLSARPMEFAEDYRFTNLYGAERSGKDPNGWNCCGYHSAKRLIHLGNEIQRGLLRW